MIFGEDVSDGAAHSREASGEARFTSEDVAAILRERGWMGEAEKAAPEELEAWLDRAARLLGPKAADREALGALLELIFHYDARAVLQSQQAHIVMARAGARAVIRELGREVLGGREIDSDRLKEIFDRVKQ